MMEESVLIFQRNTYSLFIKSFTNGEEMHLRLVNGTKCFTSTRFKHQPPFAESFADLYQTGTIYFEVASDHFISFPTENLMYRS